jgi:hypothetical protein
MQSHQFIKYAFRIRTKLGVVVDNLMIHGRDEHEAQRKLRQVYHDCQIIECICHHGSVTHPGGKFRGSCEHHCPLSRSGLC